MDTIQLIGLVLGSNAFTTALTWVLSRRKNNADANSTEIDNVIKQLEFYKELVNDYKKQLQEYIELCEDTRLEVLRLRKTVGKIVNDVCLSKNCSKRIYMDDIQVEALMGGDKNKETLNVSKDEKTN